jgi:hypothetical protein
VGPADEERRVAAVVRASARVRKAERELAVARSNFRSELHDAVDAGVSKSALGRALGVTRQRIQKYFE